MSSPQVDVGVTLRLLTEVATTTVRGRLTYRATEPYAVTLVFHVDADHPIEWVFARELLQSGLSAPSGEGDVRIWPADVSSELFLELRSPSGQAVFAVKAARIRWFLAQTARVAPFGAEGALLDIDLAVGLLLNGDPGVAPI